MKKILLFIPILLILIQTQAQAPQKMSFQAVIRKSNNGLVMMQPVSMRISVIQGSANGTIVYQETHAPTTNSNGLVSLEIGTGTIVSGTFANINWGNGPYFIKTETDPLCGTNYTVVGVSEFLSVPYALYALNSTNSGYLGSSKTVLNLATLKPEINFLITVTPGLAYTPLNNILVTNGIDNHLHAIVLEYDPITGLMLLKPFEITGAGTFNKWTVNLDGSRGANGLEGQQGQQGLNGLNGLIGAMGPQGNIGNTGSQGLVGLTGLSGTNGLQGLQGLTGTAGINGINGLVGATGPMGQQGSIGNTGIQGIMGLTGATGLQGLQGIDGPAGGATGATGPTGLTGEIGLTGLTGATGVQGIQGNIGLTGTPGVQGVVGNMGSQGLAGLDGSNGATGVTGATGPVGGFDPSTVLSPINGGLGIANNVLSTVTIAGSNPMTFTNTGTTNVTLPLSGTLYGTKTSSFSSTELLNSLSDKTGTGTAVFSISPVFTSVPTAPTAVVGTNTTQLATTEFVIQNKLPKQFSISSGTEISTTSTSDVVAGDMMLTPGVGKYFVTFNSQYTIASSASLTNSVTDLNSVYTNLMAKTNTGSHGVTYADGTTFLAGVYTTTGAATAGGTITLDAQNIANAEFIFKFDAAFSTSANTIINLVNGASACNVYWIAEGAIALGASTIMKGTMISNNGAVSTGSLCNVEGRMYSKNGALALDATTLSLPTGCSSPTNYGFLNGFAAFTSSGNVNNVGSSFITGDVGTNSGSNIGFSTAIINGNYYTPINPTISAAANFSIYQNNVLIPYSTRTRISTLNQSEISLTAIAIVGDSEAIDIRWKVDAGTIKLQNRILTLIEVK